MRSDRKLRIAIVGYGIAGIAAAVLLRRLGHEIVHFEQTREPSNAGSGLLLQPTGLAVLKELGLLDTALTHGAMISRLIGENRRGATVMDLRYNEFEPGSYGLGIQRAALFQLLRGADTNSFDLQASIRIDGVDAERGYLFDGDSRSFGPFDLVIGADGASSRVRNSLVSLERRDRSYPWGALVGLFDDSDNRFESHLVQRFWGSRHVSIWPVGSLEPGAPRRINLSWRCSVKEQAQLVAGDTGNWKRQVSALCPAVTPLLSQISDMRDLFPATYRDVQLRRYAQGRVVLLGDAAHSMSPQLGQGASMALLDARTLAFAIDRHSTVQEALAEFDHDRRAHLAIYQRISRAVTPVFQSGSRTLTMLRDRAFFPLNRVAYFRRSMLRTLSGRQQGLFGTLTLQTPHA
ncbi:MAG: FAD-dependent monooxygenase [Proteobacteria bacterium]|nr:FAD-dependent monooxygenase [Pseudomonadota bacterium]